MNATLQNRIAPPAVANQKNFDTEKTIEKAKVIDSNAPKKTDFRDLISNSNSEAVKDREAKKNGDLSGAKTEAEFLEKLSKRNEPVRVPKNNLDKDDFMKLFVTQLQHQDPLNPDDSAEMASKLAQFNSLEQMMNVNTTLGKMATAQNSGRQLQMVDYVGKDITIAGGRIRLKGGKVSESIFDLPAPSSETSLQVRDAAGVIVAESKLGAMPAGEQKFAWDGKGKDGKPAGDGVYTFNLSAKSIDNQDIPVTIQSRVKILGVDIQDTNGSVFTDFGKVKLQDIVSVGSPGFGAATPATPPAAAAPTAAQGAPGTPPGGPTPEQLQQILEKSIGAKAGAVAGADKPAVSSDPKATPRSDYSMQTDPASGMMPGITNEALATKPEPKKSDEKAISTPADVAANGQPRGL